jgi:hypothetical protein
VGKIMLIENFTYKDIKNVPLFVERMKAPRPYGFPQNWI